MNLLLDTLFQASIRSLVVALIVGLVLAAARVRSSSLRHTAWLGVLCAMLLMPVLPEVVPAVTTPVAVPVIESEIAFFVPEAPPVVDVLRSADAGSMAPADPPRPRHNWLSLIILGLYTTGVVMLLSRLIGGWFAVRQVIRASTPIAGQDGPLYESSRIATPVTIGIFRPRIFLPRAWRDWPSETLRAVLAHELAHVERRDTLTSLVAHVNRCVFWFHPLAWWLQRKLALTAECACDDAAIRKIGESRRYAAVLLDMAETMRRSGRRLSWQALGVDGAGGICHRIDRVLAGGPFAGVSRTRTVVTAVSCALVILVVAACREKSAAPLKEDPALAEVRAQNKQYADRGEAIARMTTQQATDLELRLKDHPDDLDARKNLMNFYQASGRGVEAIRTHVLWFIRNHPEDGYALLVTSSDPIGYEEKRKLWRALAERKDAPPRALWNAANFFVQPDPQFAEKLFLRAGAAAPTLPTTRWLGNLYASVLTGAFAPTPYGEEVRKKLDQSNDPVLLESTGLGLLRNFGQPHYNSAAAAALAKSYLQRARQLNPQSTAATTDLLMLKRRDLYARMMPIQKHEPVEKWYPAVAALPEADRFHLMPDLAETAYWRGQSLDYDQHNHQAAVAAWELVRKVAGDALRLAPKYRNDENYGTAIYKSNIALGMVAMRVDGNKRAATRYLLAAAKAPPTDELRYMVDGLDLKLAVVLLRYGGADERSAVIEYLERYGKIVQRRDVDYLHAAQQLRQGYMPIWYEVQAAQLK